MQITTTSEQDRTARLLRAMGGYAAPMIELDDGDVQYVYIDREGAEHLANVHPDGRVYWHMRTEL